MCDRSETDETLLTKQKIHKISREIKKQELSLYSCLRSIEEDLRFVEEGHMSDSYSPANARQCI
eukprot:jgi/Pico_ML_1/55559/g1228.t1